MTAVILSVGVVLYALMVREVDVAPPEKEPPARQLEERKAAIDESLRDLAFEYRVGKISERDYQATRRELEQELTAIDAELARLDNHAGKAVPAAAQPGKRAAAGGTECPHCGARFAQPMKFCGECGRPMAGGLA
ncbi:MAG: hypothetical protein ACP5U2_02290 [Bryobacteraceae bacterium]